MNRPINNLSKRQQNRLCKKRAHEIENELVAHLGEDPISSPIKSIKINNQSSLDNNLLPSMLSDESSHSDNISVINSDVPCNEDGFFGDIKNTPSISFIRDQLASWALKHNIPNTATTNLLHILHPLIPDLPLDSRTLLNTPRSCDIHSCGDGQFKYFGIKNHLISRLSSEVNLDYHPIMKQIADEYLSQGLNLVTVSINVDGLPISSSSTKAFWPILGVVDQSFDKQPFVIGLYCGGKKPASVNEFLRPFVDECLELERNGITVKGIQYAFRVSCFIADAPARQFLKCIVSHSSSNACEKCLQEGSSYNRRMTWLVEKNPMFRTDEGFNNLEYIDEHQRSRTVLSELSIGLVSNIPLEYLHLLCLGIMKKLVRVWVFKGPKKCKLRASSIQNISDRLQIIARNHMPLEFARKPRSLDVFKFWKATEYRSFILYLGPVVLLQVLPEDLYDHFLAFHVSIYILVSKRSYDLIWRSYAKRLIDSFLEFIPKLYSKELLIYNFHNLSHLTKDVENFGPLDKFSAFPFENFMQVIKKMVRSPNHSLEQVVKRLGERNEQTIVSNKKQVELRRDKNNEIKLICFPSSTSCALGIGLKNGCVLTKDNEIVVVRSIKMCKQYVYVFKCDKFKFKEDFYQVPLKSSKLNIFSVHTLEKMNEQLVSDQLSCKCLLLPNFSLEGKFVCIPYSSMESFY